MSSDAKDTNETRAQTHTEKCGSARVLGAAYQSCVKDRGHDGAHQSSSGDTWQRDPKAA
jgi:hypothetical protein